MLLFATLGECSVVVRGKAEGTVEAELAPGAEVRLAFPADWGGLG